MTTSEVEKLEEAKLKAKYPLAGGGPLSGHSSFLQKKLAKGVIKFNHSKNEIFFWYGL